MTAAAPVLCVDIHGVPIDFGGGGGGGNVNLISVGGTNIALGPDTNPTGTLSLPVVFPTGYTLQVAGTVTTTLSALVAGTAIIGKVGIDQTTDGTTNAVHLVAGTAIAGKFGIDQTTPGTTNAVQMIPGTAGGLSQSSSIIPNNTTAIVVKSGAGQLYAIEVFNNGAVIAYIKVYNATSATAGSGTPVSRHMIPAPTAGGGGGVIFSIPDGVAHSTGITYIITTGIADNDTGAPAANNYIVNFYYK